MNLELRSYTAEPHYVALVPWQCTRCLAHGMVEDCAYDWPVIEAAQAAHERADPDCAEFCGGRYVFLRGEE
jgi:hypothetical protein